MTFEVPSGPHIKCADCVDFYYNNEMILHLLNYICYTINNQTGMHHIKTKNTLLSQSETDPVMNRKAVIPPPPHFSCCICIDHKGGDAYVKSAGTDA